MGLSLFCDDPSAPIPRAVVLELRCDGDHGLFPPESAQFREDGFVSAYAKAMKEGWLDRSLYWLGPCCSGKAQREQEDD